MEEYHERRESKKWKIILDFASILFISVFILDVAWSLLISRSFRSTIFGRLPAQVEIMLIDLIPLIFGINWLLYRYAAIVKSKYPVLFFPSIWIIFAFFLPFLLASIHWARR